MTRLYALAFLTVADVGPVEAIRIAGEAGFDRVGLRILPAAASGEGPYPLLTDKALLAEARRAIADSGIRVGDVEIVRLKPQTKADEFVPFLECAAALGASNILVAGDDPEQARLTENFAAFAALASKYRLTADLEFMPWTAVQDATQAIAVVEAAAEPNGGVLADALHWDRSGRKASDLDAIPTRCVNYIQLCDAAKDYDPSDEALIRVARGERMMPGAGGIDLVSFIRSMPAEAPISVEVASRELAALHTPAQRAAMALKTARDVVARAGHGR
ncbi:sugar phosphate isomerase/epimerase family protein [Rhizobium sullae]|uniref:TIM barrel protein n=1 Tax=Rhizobium sullae TaxID=50338 RepID=A0ABY5XXV5_RHISU|nr:TIM barrel protein [Rhizobium sullae]UWU19330.1 TIM barrel protein [Rhizobium sullae]